MSFKNEWLTGVGIMLISMILALRLGGAGFPAPQGDDAFFKSPAAELALNGRLAIPCVEGFLPRAREIYANYPPLYQLVLAAWYCVLGFSLNSSLAFDYLVHAINAIAIALIARRVFLEYSDDDTVLGRLLCAAAGLIHVANLAYFDRPEELGLIWLWIEVLLVRGCLPGVAWWRTLVSGGLVGMAALTAPWVGALAAMVVTFRLLAALTVMTADQRSRAVWITSAVSLLSVAFISAAMVGAWQASIELLYPGALDAQMVARLDYARPQLAGSPVERLTKFARTLFYHPSQLPATAVVIMFLPVAIRKRGCSSANALALYVAGVFGMLVVAAVRPGAYPYLGGCQTLLLPCFPLAVRRFVNSSKIHIGSVVGTAVVVSVLLLSYQDVGRLWIQQSNLPSEATPERVFADIAQIVPQGDTVAVSPRHWHLFQNRNDWRDAYFCSHGDDPELLRCDWLVLYPDMGVPDVIDAFEFIAGNAREARWPGAYEFSVWRRKTVQRTGPVNDDK